MTAYRHFFCKFYLLRDWRRGWLLLCWLVVTAAYTSLALYFAGFKAFWSPDSAARFAMMQSWIKHGSLAPLYYREAALDPSGQIHPLNFFLVHTPHGLAMMYLPLFPVLSGLSYRAFSFPGLALLPVLCGLGTIVVTSKTAYHLGLRAWFLLPLVLGLATPLVLYSVVFWDHSAQMLIAALAGYWMLRSVQTASLRDAVITGILLGVGMWVHELFLAVFVAVWLAATPFWQGRRYIPYGLLLGFLPSVLVWGLFNLWLYGTFAGPHLAANILQNNVDHPFSLALILNQSHLADRAMSQLVGASASKLWDATLPYYLLFICLLDIYTLTAWIGKPLHNVIPLLGLTAAAAALFLLLKTPGEANGLLEATPLLIPALAVPWYVRPAPGPVWPPHVFYAWLSRSCWLFILLVLVTPISPGLDWGSRYLLAALPLLVLLALHALERQYQQADGSWRHLVMASAAGLVGISLVCQCDGALWIRRCLAYGQELNAHIDVISSPLLVTDTGFEALATEGPPSQARFFVRSLDDEKLLASILRQRQYSELTFVGSQAGKNNMQNVFTSAGQNFVVQEDRPLWVVNYEREMGDDLQLLRFTLRPKTQVQHERE